MLYLYISIRSVGCYFETTSRIQTIQNLHCVTLLSLISDVSPLPIFTSVTLVETSPNFDISEIQPIQPESALVSPIIYYTYKWVFFLQYHQYQVEQGD